MWHADMAQEAEHVLGKDEVTGSNPVISSNKKTVVHTGYRFLLCVVDAGSMLKGSPKSVILGRGGANREMESLRQQDLKSIGFVTTRLSAPNKNPFTIVGGFFVCIIHY